jgi:hypothetical protein
MICDTDLEVMAHLMILSEDVSATKSEELPIDLSDKPKGIYPICIILKSRILRDKLVLE